MSYQYKIFYQFDPETRNVIATIPGLNYISSFGENFKEAEANIREAALAYLESFAKEKREFPIEKINQEGTYLRLNFNPS